MCEEEDPSPCLEGLFEEITKMSATLQMVAADVSTIKETTAELKTEVAAIHVRLNEVEARISQLEETSERLDAADDKRTKQVDMMWERIKALENHSKRHNVRVIGLGESLGINETLLTCSEDVGRGARSTGFRGI